MRVFQRSLPRVVQRVVQRTLPLALAMLLLPASPSFAQQKLLPAQSDISFVSKQMGVAVEGRFKKFDADIRFDPAKAAASQVAFTIDTGSATLGAPQTDAELPKAAWFNVPKFPQATFQSSSVHMLGNGKLEVRGQLRIKGNVREVMIPVQLAQTAGNTVATGSFTLQRLAYKIGENEWADTSVVADEVLVKFKLVLTGVAKL
jgi:polyisoprenoid-binding protein YceI